MDAMYQLPARAANRLLGRWVNGRFVQDEWVHLRSYLSTIAIWTIKFWSFVFLGLAWCLGLACTSVLAYLLFYHYMIPQHHTAIPVHFDFSTTATPPTAIVHLHGEKQWRYQELNTTLEVAAEQSKSRYFSPGHQYHAFLDFSFPDSSMNHECGMLSVEMHAMSQQTIIATSLQSFLPQYTSPLVRWMWSWVFAVPLITGIIQEKQTLTLHMFDQLLELEQAPISEFRILLKSANAPKFQLYTSTLRLQVQLTGLRYYMYHWPFSTATIVCMIIFSFQLFWSSALLLILCLMCCSGEPRLDEDDMHENQPEPDDPSEIDPFILGEPDGFNAWSDNFEDDENFFPSDEDDQPPMEGQMQPASEGQPYRTQRGGGGISINQHQARQARSQRHPPTGTHSQPQQHRHRSHHHPTPVAFHQQLNTSSQRRHYQSSRADDGRSVSQGRKSGVRPSLEGEPDPSPSLVDEKSLAESGGSNGSTRSIPSSSSVSSSVSSSASSSRSSSGVTASSNVSDHSSHKRHQKQHHQQPTQSSPSIAESQSDEVKSQAPSSSESSSTLVISGEPLDLNPPGHVDEDIFHPMTPPASNNSESPCSDKIEVGAGPEQSKSSASTASSTVRQRMKR